MRWLVLLLAALPLFAETQLCRFRADEAENPFRRWLASPDVICGAETEPIPVGSWNVFSRSETAVSFPLLVTDRTIPPASARTLIPGARLTFSLPEGQRGVVYAPRRAVAWPAGERMLVPSGEPLWLLGLDRSGTVVSLLPIAPLEAGSERAVLSQSVRSPVLLAWLHVDPSSIPALRKASSTESPRVRYGALDADPLPPLDALPGAFVLVRGVTAGEAELEIGGKGWLPHRMHAKVGANVVTSIASPLQVRPASSLIVSFSTQEDLIELERSVGSCGEKEFGPPQYAITVSACAQPSGTGEFIDVSTCSAVKTETFLADIPYGSFAIDDVAPGFYRAELKFGKLPPMESSIMLPPLEQRPLGLAGEYNALHGNLTRDGEPLDYDATIGFPQGIGFAVHESGEYHAVLLAPVEQDQKIEVRACEGEVGALLFAESDSRWNTRFDLDIPDNRLVVEVTDTFTSMPLHAATLHYTVMSRRARNQPIDERKFKASGEDSSRFVLKAVPERVIHLEISHPGYQRYRVVPFTMEKRGEKVIEAQLVPLRGSRGRIVSARPFVDATLFWMSTEGAIVETVELGPDGSFVYANRHDAGETMAVVSRSHPLWVLRMPLLQARQELEVPFPDTAGSRSLLVSIRQKPRAATHIGFVIGGLLVPHAALRQHQSLRNGRAVVHGGTSELFPAFAETGPFEVILGPTINDLPPSVGRRLDPLLLLQAIDAPRRRAPAGVNEIVFEE